MRSASPSTICQRRASLLAGFSLSEARRLFGPPPGLDAATEKHYLVPWGAETAARRYLKRFEELGGKTKAGRK